MFEYNYSEFLNLSVNAENKQLMFYYVEVFTVTAACKSYLLFIYLFMQSDSEDDHYFPFHLLTSSKVPSN